MAPFNPYHKWLGIPPDEQPPNHYRLLGIPELESDADVIDTAAERQTLLLRTFQTGDQAQLAEQLLNEVSAARVCLLNSEQKASYDQQLQVATQPAPVPTPALVENDPLGIADLQPTAAVRQPSRRTETAQLIWQQPRILAAAGAVAVVLLFIFLNSGGEPQVPNTDNAEERKAEVSQLVEERVKQELAQAEQERLAKEKAEAERLAAAEKAAAEKLAAEKAIADTVVALEGHSNIVKSAAFSPDGSRIVSGGDDHIVKMWDVETRQVTLTLKGHSDRVESVSFSPDGKRIVSGSFDKTVKVWDTAIGVEILTLKGHTEGIKSVAFSPDGKWIVSGSHDKLIKVWDSETGREKLTLEGHSDEVYSVAFSPDGKRIASGSHTEKAMVKIWDSETGREKLTLKGHQWTVMSLAFSPDSTRIASGSWDKTVKVWNAETGQLMLTLEGHTEGLTRLAYSPDGKWIVSGSHDKLVKVWDSETGREMLTLKGHTAPVSTVAFSPDSMQIISGGFDKTIKIWNLRSVQTTEPSNLPAAIAAFRTAQAKQYQQAWAKYLGVSVEYTNSIGMKFMLIPPGRFMMGSPEAEKGRIDNEVLHSVRLTRPFYLGMYEVTQQQYETMMGNNPSVHKGPTQPVEQVSWNNSVEFCRKLNEKEDVKYRLPTEAEWEYACRAGTTTLWSFGDDESQFDKYAWFRGNSGDKPHPVGQKKPNRWGLYDLHGNVNEWCQDWYGPYPSEAVTDPNGPTVGKDRVMRDGSGGSPPVGSRSAARNHALPGYNDHLTGFRVVHEISKEIDSNTLSPESRSLPASLQQGLVAYYPFNGNAQDENGNHGEVHGTAFAPDRFGALERSCRFNGKADITAKIKDIPVSASPRTVTCWITVAQGDLLPEQSIHVLVQWGRRIPGEAFGVFFIGNQPKKFMVSSFGSDLDSGVSVNTEWHHLVCLYDDTLMIYVDGVLRGEKQVTIETAASEVVIGREVAVSACFFKGSLDDIRIYNRALSAAEVKALYEFEKP